MKRVYNITLLIYLVWFAGINCRAQNNDRAILRQVIKENQEAVDAIAMYPTDTRKIIFESAEYPEVIAKLNSMQKNTQAGFEKLIVSYSKDEQEKIWNLTRYPDLISAIAADHKKSEAELNTIIANYPEEIHKTALDEGLNNYDLLVQIDNMNKSYNGDFELMLNGDPAEAANAFREIIKLPEVLSILFDHMQYTVVIGDYYKKNPERVLHKTDSLNQVLTQKNAKDANDWKQSMTDDPQAQQEYTQAAQEYAQDNGYQPQDYTAPLTPDVTDYNTNPYSWWFGYPSWYPYNYWNPYPYWYDWGFYYGPGGVPVFFGLPSAYFMNWYFYYPQHSYRYPELSSHYYDYYNRHPESRNYNSISYSVNNWRNNNKSIVTSDWDKDNANRAQRFKQYGQMEMDRSTYNTKHPYRQLEQTQYIQKKENKYPIIAADNSKNQLIQKNAKANPVQENTMQPFRQPTVSIPSQYKAAPGGQLNNNSNKQSQPAYKKPQTANTNTPNQTEHSNQIRNAQQYHQTTWSNIQSQPERQTQQQNYSPPRQVEQPARQESPASSGGGRRR